MNEPEKSEFHFSPRANRASEINWLPWGEEAWRLSADSGKPVLLSISAVWCHWCHVMDETSYSDSQVISLVNEKFVAVRVDSDRRPEINSRYNQGGWPSTVFMTHEGEIIAGTTYIPADQLCRLLNDVSDLFASHEAEIAGVIERAREMRLSEPASISGPCDWSMVDYVTGLAEQGFDSENGGFGTEPKFPYATALSLLLKRLAADAPGNMGEIVRLTLEKMAAGGIFDQVAGGFFRYATAADWSAPHYEKLLEDNAAMMEVFLDGYRLSGEADYTMVAYKIHKYLTSTLLDPGTGAFFGSQDADEEYYRLAAAEREARPAPMVDKTIYSGANALAASAFLSGFQVLGDAQLREQALTALGFIWENLWDDDHGPYHYFDEKPQAPGLLLDAARLAAACLDAYESGAGDVWLDRSTKAASWMLTHLEDKEAGGFFDCALLPASTGYPSEQAKPIVENSVAASALIRIGQNTGQKKFTDAARRSLESYSGSFQEFGLFAAEYAQAIARLLDPPVRVTVVGAPQDEVTSEMIRAACRARIPFRSLEVIDPDVYGEDLAETGYAYEGSPVAYVCIGSSCQPPVKDPVELPGRLENGWAAISPSWHPAG